MVETEKESRAKEQARAQLDSIVKMVKRLQHVQECTGNEDCELTDQDIFAGINIYYEEGMVASEDDKKEYHDENAAWQRINEDPLSVQVRTGWYTPGTECDPEEFEILLCTGGPAVRILGEINKHGLPLEAHIEYQDWFTPWEKYHETSSEEDEALLAYCQQFYFGE